MQIKKLSIIVLAVLAALLIMVPFVSADEADAKFGLAVETNVSAAEPDLPELLNVGEGDLVTVKFVITKNEGIAALEFDLDYDSTVLDIIKDENGKFEVLNPAEGFATYGGILVKEDGNGKIFVQVFAGKNISVYTGDVFTLNFVVSQTTHSDVEIGVSNVHVFTDANANVQLDASEISVETADLVCHGDKIGESNVVEPTCLEGGYSVVKCAGCDLEIKYNEVEPTGHDFTITTVEPTCEEGGYSTRTCKVCGFSEKFDEKAALGHKEVIIPAVEATDNAEGKTEGKKCERCGKILVEQTTIPAKGFNLLAQWWFWLIIAVVVIAIIACICVVVAKKKKAGKTA